jgi:competence transcription factor ComK
LNHTFDGKDRPMIQKFSISYSSIALKNILRSIHIESVKNMPFDKIEIKYLNRALKLLYKYKNFYYKYNRSFLFFSNKRFLNFYNL